MNCKKALTAAAVLSSLVLGASAGDEWVYDTSGRPAETKSVQSDTLGSLRRFSFMTMVSNVIDLCRKAPGLAVIFR